MLCEHATHPEYQHRLNPKHFDDTTQRDEWQDPVYRAAREWAVAVSARRVLDFGCGSGFKLMKYFSGFQTVGYEIQPALRYVQVTYGDHRWEPASFDGSFVGDMLICSDVLEHLLDPMPLMYKMRRGPCPRFVLSTPALEILAERGQTPRLGPPNNESHVREWTTLEFRKFVETYLRIVDHRVDGWQGTQMILAELPSMFMREVS